MNSRLVEAVELRGRLLSCRAAKNYYTVTKETQMAQEINLVKVLHSLDKEKHPVQKLHTFIMHRGTVGVLLAFAL